MLTGLEDYEELLMVILMIDGGQVMILLMMMLHCVYIVQCVHCTAYSMQVSEGSENQA